MWRAQGVLSPHTMANHKPLTVREVAESLSLSVATIRAWIASRRIGFVRLGRAIRVPRSEVERLLESGFVPPRRAGGGRGR